MKSKSGRTKKKMGRDPNMGRLFGRTDLERCDLFYDMGFLDWGRYSSKPLTFRDSAVRGRQMYSSVPAGGKKKCGLQGASGYFDPNFKSVSVNDPYIERWKTGVRGKTRPKHGPWVPCGPVKYKDAFLNLSPGQDKPKKKKAKEPINFLTNPGKKGNCGYANICINKYPPHDLDGKVDPYTAPEVLYSKNWKMHKLKILNGPLKAGFYPGYFDDNPYRDPKIGPVYVEPTEKYFRTNNKIFYPNRKTPECFSKFPAWSPEKYMTLRDVEKAFARDKTDEIFRPQPGLKSYYTTSVVNHKLESACNENTWKTMKPITYPQFSIEINEF